MPVLYLNSKHCELAVIGLAICYFAFSTHLMDVPLCPSAFFMGIPCPTCGTTRSVWHILHGDFALAWTYNPIGFLVVLLLFRRLLVLSFECRVLNDFLCHYLLDRALLSAFFLAGFFNIAAFNLSR